jgi:hypothetical protein
MDGHIRNRVLAADGGQLHAAGMYQEYVHDMVLRDIIMSTHSTEMDVHNGPGQSPVRQR